jgi:F-type H+-transporting ATPase subunit delta
VVHTAVARRYAKALIDLQDASGIDPTAAALRLLAEAFASSREFRALLLSPVFTKEEKAAVVDQVAAMAKCPPITSRFLAHLVRKNRIVFIREISDAFVQLADQASNRKAVQVVAARPLSDKQQAAVRTRLEQVTRGKVDLAVQTDPGMISGLEIRFGSRVYDGTVRGQLERLRAILTRT